MIEFLKIFHLCSLFVLTALVGVAAAVPFASGLAQYRKPVLMWSGIASLLVFLSGFGLLGMEKLGVPGWAILKVICWLLVSALAGLMFRRPEKVKAFSCLGAMAIVVALVMVFFKPVL